MTLTRSKYAAIFLLAALLLAAYPFLTMAATPTGTTSPPSKWTNVQQIIDFLNEILDVLFTIFLIVAVIMLVLAAFNYLTAGGDEEKVDKAKNMVKYAVIAIIIALLAASIPTVLDSFL